MTYLCEYCGTRFWGEHKCDKLPLHLRNWVNESSAEIKKDRHMVPLRWSASGPPNESNAFGEIVSVDSYEGKPIGVICEHGGSMWLCRSCRDKILALNNGRVRLATAVEYTWLRQGSQGPFPPDGPIARLKRWWRS